ncbi:hypothetical protein TUM3792_16540 [Shewanella sp. MBTL60-007]|nr:hypothetical protein TUM3792_16540 [Shewanella sp. MBTL60-007]
MAIGKYVANDGSLLMKGILHAELEVETPFHDVDSMGYNCWHGFAVQKVKLASEVGAC